MRIQCVYQLGNQANQNRINKMYRAIIEKVSEKSFYAIIVRDDPDENEIFVVRNYSKYFKTLKGAEKSTAAYIAKHF